MTEKEFNKERDRLIHKMSYGSLLERITAYGEFVKFMETNSENTHWNTKYTCLYVGEKTAKQLKKLIGIRKNKL